MWSPRRTHESQGHSQDREQGTGSPAATGIPGAERRGQHALYWLPGRPPLGGCEAEPHLELGAWKQGKLVDSKLLCQPQTKERLSLQEIPLEKGRQKAKTTFTAS